MCDNSAAFNFTSGNQLRGSFSGTSTGTPLLCDGTTMPSKQIQLFEVQTRSRQSSLAPVVSNSIYPDDYNTGPDSMDAVIASAEPRVSWPMGMDGYDTEPDPMDAIIASAEPRISWPTIDDLVPVEHGAYQWSPPNIPNNILGQHSVAAT